jgi:FAD/FMN-containing dehydrogenase
MAGAGQGRSAGRTTRRRFLAGSAAAGAGLLWSPVFQLKAAEGASGAPPGFPAGISLYRQAFENWALEIIVDDLWTCAPRTADDVVRLANWAHKAGWRLRPRGHMHGWSPFTVRPGLPGQDRTVLVDTTSHLTGITMASSSPAAVRAQAGASLDDMLDVIAQHGHGLAATPAVGSVTLGGMLAIDAHGASLPAHGEHRAAGHTYGSLSNLVLSIDAVVWDRKHKRYKVRTFHRDHPDCKALLVNLGRVFITEATLRVGPAQTMRCVSSVDIPNGRLFAPPGGHGPDRFADFVEETGRVEAILFPHTDSPWLKVWSLAPKKPKSARVVTGPYNYPFSDSVPPEVTNPAGRIVAGDSWMTPEFGRVMYTVAAGGLAATNSADIWGAANDVTRYIRATTLRYCELGFTVITERRRVQQVLSAFFDMVDGLVGEFEERGLYPLNGPIELRCCGLDHPADSGAEGAESPVLSAVRPHPDHPEWNTAIWLNTLTFAGTPGAPEFLRRIEQWVFRTQNGNKGIVRPEWSKGWAYSGTSTWADRRMLRHVIPNAYRAGREPDDDWDWAVKTFDRLDPHRVFTNAFMDHLLR